DARKKDKHSVMWLDAVEVAGKPVFSAVAALDDREPNWIAVLDLPTKEYNAGKKLDTLVNRGKFHVRCLSGYRQDGATCAMLWHPESRLGFASPDAIDDQALVRIEHETANGQAVRLFRPYSVDLPNPHIAFATEELRKGKAEYAWKLTPDELM